MPTANVTEALASSHLTLQFACAISYYISTECCNTSCTDKWFNSLPASGEFCHLLLIFENSLEPDQARKYIRPDLDPYCLTF